MGRRERVCTRAAVLCMTVWMWSTPAAAQVPCPDTEFGGMTFHPLDCIPVGQPPGIEDVKDLLGVYISQLIQSGADMTMGSEAGQWDCTVDGATIWIFVPDPLAPQSDGFTFGENDIALNWDSFFTSPPPPDIGQHAAYYAGLLTILFHELHHTVFIEWITGACAGSSSCVQAWECVHQANIVTGDPDENPCVEWFTYAETARDLCQQACLQPPGSDMRLELQFQAEDQASKGASKKAGCQSLTVPMGPCPMPPFPPSAFPEGSSPPNLPESCCCQEGQTKEDCESCNEFSGDCDP